MIQRTRFGRYLVAQTVRHHPALGSSDFRKVFLNAFFASASFWTMLLARGWLVFELTGQGAWVGAVTFAGMIQMVLAGPLGGALADRADRRRIAMAADAVGIVAAVGLAGLTLPGLVEPWHVLVFAASGGLARAFGTPAEQAIIPNVVPREHLLNAIALSGITRNGSRIVGPLFGGALLAWFGAGSVFLLSAALLTLALYQLTRLQYRSEARPRADGASALTLGALFSDIGDGFAYVERDPRLVVVLVLVGFHCGATMAFDSMMPTLATVVGGSSLTFSGIVVGIGAGAIVGTFVVSMLPTEEATGRSFLVVGVGSGLAMLVIGFATTPFMAVTGGVLAGATQASYMALSSTFVQAIVPDAFRGRVMSLYVLLAAGHMAFVNFGFGWLSDGIGVRALLIVPGLLWIVVFVAAVFLLPEVRALVSTGAFRARPAPAAVSAEA